MYGEERRAWETSGSWGSREMLGALCRMCGPGMGQERQCVCLDEAAGFKVIAWGQASAASRPISGSASHPCQPLGK